MASLFSKPKTADTSAQEKSMREQTRLANAQDSRLREQERKERQGEAARKRALMAGRGGAAKFLSAGELGFRGGTTSTLGVRSNG